jgi:hypothetical protein
MFRFENLEIWKKSIDIAERLFDIADDFEKRKLYKFAEQLRGAALSIIQQYCRRFWQQFQEGICPIFEYCQKVML